MRSTCVTLLIGLFLLAAGCSTQTTRTQMMASEGAGQYLRKEIVSTGQGKGRDVYVANTRSSGAIQAQFLIEFPYLEKPPESKTKTLTIQPGERVKLVREPSPVASRISLQWADLLN